MHRSGSHQRLMRPCWNQRRCRSWSFRAGGTRGPNAQRGSSVGAPDPDPVPLRRIRVWTPWPHGQDGQWQRSHCQGFEEPTAPPSKCVTDKLQENTSKYMHSEPCENMSQTKKSRITHDVWHVSRPFLVVAVVDAVDLSCLMMFGC